MCVTQHTRICALSQLFLDDTWQSQLLAFNSFVQNHKTYKDEICHHYCMVCSLHTVSQLQIHIQGQTQGQVFPSNSLKSKHSRYPMTTHCSKTDSVNYVLLSHITIYQVIPVRSWFPSYCRSQKPCGVCYSVIPPQYC